jgi:hypothetical protein
VAITNFTQVWIRNEPETREPASLAKNVPVRLAVYGDSGVAPLIELGTQWVAAIDPD